MQAFKLAVPIAPFAAAFAAGLCSSTGPCVGPRCLVLGAVTGGGTWRENARAAGLFIGGLACVYAAFGAAASWFAHAVTWSAPIYAVLSALLLAWGLRITLAPSPPCARATCREPRTPGAPFIFGAASALVVSPCCTPFVIGAVNAAAADGTPFFGAALMAAFALGHGAPLALASAAFSGVRHAAGRIPSDAIATINGAIMLAMGAYYAVLA